jgi:hypothetical protein
VFAVYGYVSIDELSAEGRFRVAIFHGGGILPQRPALVRDYRCLCAGSSALLP